MRYRKVVIILMMSSVLAGCSSTHIEDLRQESEGLTRNVIHELREVQTRQQLQAKTRVLKGYFNAMADLVIAVETKTAEENAAIYAAIDDGAAVDSELSTALREELSRLYRIAGGREIVEAAQKEAMYKLQSLKGRSQTLWERKMEKSDDAFPGRRDE